MSKKDFKNTEDYSYLKQRHTNILDLVKTPKYGLVDQFGNQVQIKKEKLGVSTKYNVILVQDIIPLFEEMMEYFENLNKKQLIDSNGTFLNNLKPINLYKDPDKLEYEAIKAVVERLKVYCLKYNVQWRDFEQFCQIFFDMLRAGSGGGSGGAHLASSMPSVRASCVGASSVLLWGLGVGFAHTRDKIRNRANVYQDKYFDTFASVSKYFGFMINYHDPLQLIFNLRSEALSISLDTIFDDWYTRTIGSQLEKNFYRLVTVYELVNEELPFYQIKKFDGCRTKIKQLSKVAPPKIDKVNTKYLYFDYMIAMNNINILDSDRKRYLNILDSLDHLEATEYVNSVTTANSPR